MGMLILIAESKTMKGEEIPVSAADWRLHRPLEEDMADAVMASLRDRSVAELSEELKLSGMLAVKMQKMIYEFPNKSLGLEAIEAYTGVVFKALDYATLTSEAQETCRQDVRIISSLYGWLRPNDIVKPYRLDFTAKVNDMALAGYWRQAVTIQLVRKLQEGGYSEILNLLPGDASKCIDWKLTKRFAKVWKVDFVELLEGGMRKTPTANKLKTMRGELLRQILMEGIQDAATLRHASSERYMGEGTPVYPDHLSFLC